MADQLTGEHFHKTGRGVASHEHGSWEPGHTHQAANGIDGGPAGATKTEAEQRRREQLSV